MLRLSKRLLAVADMVQEAKVLADVGTDHGYIPIYLTLYRNLTKSIAMDVNPGPLQRAKEHISQYALGHRIETRLSDGLAALEPGEADTIVIAGMGGALMARILTQGDAVAHSALRLVLQPQSELYEFHSFLKEHDYQLIQEDMVYEDGKFYTVIAAVWKGSAKKLDAAGDGLGILPDSALKYGPLLLEHRHPILHQYLLRQKEQKEQIQKNLQEHARRDVSARKTLIGKELAEIDKLLELWKEQEHDMP